MDDAAIARRWKRIAFSAIVLSLVSVLAVVFLIGACKNDQPRKDVTSISELTPTERMRTLSIAKNWSEVSPRAGEWFVFAGLLIASIGLMVAARRSQPTYQGEVTTLRGPGADNQWKEDPVAAGRQLVGTKVKSLAALFARDFGSLTFDVATHEHRAEVTEYRGVIHWHRDVLEKLLSVFLLLCFSMFLSKGCGYMYDYVHGDVWRLSFIPLDIAIAVSIAGYALIADGVLLIAAMTDAPGIGRTIDSLIVILAGVVVLLLEVRPSETSLVAFSLGPHPWLAPGLAVSIGALFLVRWVIRHHTISDLEGSR